MVADKKDRLARNIDATRQVVSHPRALKVGEPSFPCYSTSCATDLALWHTGMLQSLYALILTLYLPIEPVTLTL